MFNFIFSPIKDGEWRQIFHDESLERWGEGLWIFADKVVGFGCGYVQKYTSEEKVYSEIFFLLK